MRDGHDVAWAMDALIKDAKRKGRGFAWWRCRRPVHRGERSIERVKMVKHARVTR